MNKLFTIVVILGGLSLCSCKQNKDVDNIKQFLGKTIYFNDIKQLEIDSMSVLSEISNKVFIYLDSVHCTPCALDNVIMWKRHKCELELFNLEVALLCNHSNPREVYDYMEHVSANFPILLDVKGEFKKKYQFLQKENFQTFVVNSKNEIIWIGSPIHNKQLWDSFCRMMNLLKINKKD